MIGNTIETNLIGETVTVTKISYTRLSAVPNTSTCRGRVRAATAPGAAISAEMPLMYLWLECVGENECGRVHDTIKVGEIRCISIKHDDVITLHGHQL